MFKKILINIKINALSLYAVTKILDVVAVEGGFLTYVYAGLIIATLNLTVKPILKVVTLPLQFMTVGLSLIALNIIIFYMADASMEYFFGLQRDIIMQTDLVSYVKVGMLFGAINWAEHLIIK